MRRKLAFLFLAGVLVTCLVALLVEAGRPAAREQGEHHPPAPARQDFRDSPDRFTEDASRPAQQGKSPPEAALSDNKAVSGHPGILMEKEARRLRTSGKARPPGEIELNGKKFKLVGKHNINPDDIKLERDGKTVTAKFPIPEEAKKKKEEPEESGKRKGE